MTLFLEEYWNHYAGIKFPIAFIVHECVSVSCICVIRQTTTIVTQGFKQMIVFFSLMVEQ